MKPGRLNMRADFPTMISSVHLHIVLMLTFIYIKKLILTASDAESDPVTHKETSFHLNTEEQLLNCLIKQTSE